MSPAGRERAFLRSRLFSVLNTCPVADGSLTAKTGPKKESVSLGIHY